MTRSQANFYFDMILNNIQSCWFDCLVPMFTPFDKKKIRFFKFDD